MELTARLMAKMVLIMPTLVTMTLGAGSQLARHLGNLASSSPNHSWPLASCVVVGVMAVVAIGILEPANLAVLFELRRPEPRGEVVGGIVLASAMPGRPPLPAAWGLLGGGALFLVAAASLGRVAGFAWWRFRQVAGWSLAAYVVIAGMLEYVFVYDHLRGATLAVLTSMLVLFALDVPVLLAFTVARYEESPTRPSREPGAAPHAEGTSPPA